MNRIYKHFLFIINLLLVMGTAIGEEPAFNAKNYIWDGIDPFSQPAHTLNYYGSGDVDNNSVIDIRDLDSLKLIVLSNLNINYRADVNGDGKISDEDAVILDEYIHSGKTLPAHWNELDTREDRLGWLKKCLALDPTSEVPHMENIFNCVCFSSQHYLNFSYLGINLSHTIFNNGGTIYNIPVYMAGLPGHAVNAALIGDDPLNYDDWYIFEPQSDLKKAIEVGTSFDIHMADFIEYNSIYGENLIIATVTEDGCDILERAEGFPAQRNSKPKTNYVDVVSSWRPTVVLGSNNTVSVLYEKLNDNLPPNLSIHISKYGTEQVTQSTVLATDTFSARILDCAKSPSGKIHLLWRGTQNFLSALYTGILDERENKIQNVTSFNDAGHAIIGRLSVISDDKRMVFWANDESNCNPSTGINFSMVTNDSWSVPQSFYLTDGIMWLNPLQKRFFIDYTFDVKTLNGEPVVAWAPSERNVEYSQIHLKFPLLDSENEFYIQSDTLVAGVRIASDSVKGVVHCIYWQALQGTIDKTSDIKYRCFSEEKWSEPVILDSSTNNRCVDIAVNDNGEILTVWEKDTNETRGMFCTRNCINGVWGDIQHHWVDENEQVGYPRVTPLQGTDYVVSWEGNGINRTELRFKNLSTVVSKIHVPKEPCKLKTNQNIQISVRNNQIRFDAQSSTVLPGIVTILDLNGKVLKKQFCSDIRFAKVNMYSMVRSVYIINVSCRGFSFTQKLNTL